MQQLKVPACFCGYDASGPPYGEYREDVLYRGVKCKRITIADAAF